MKKGYVRALKTVLAAALLIGVFYCKQGAEPEKMTVPVTQVFSYAPVQTAAPTPLDSFRSQRDTARETDVSTLSQLAAGGDERAAAYLLQVTERHEKETAIESALAAKGYAGAVCAVREGAVTVCIAQKADEKSAQTILELCEAIAQEKIENVFLLDECGYSW